MRKLLLSALFLPVLIVSCSTDEENAVTTNAANREITPKAICVPVSGETGINAQVLGSSRRLFVTWNNDLEQNPSIFYEAELQIRNGNCNTGEVSDIIDTYSVDLFNTNVYAIHQLSGTCFSWRIVLKGYKVSVSGLIPNCATQTPWSNYTP